MTRLGLWSTEAHKNPQTPKTFPRAFSQLSAEQLSDLNARIISEAGRIMELVGLLGGLEAQLKIKVKAVRASARSRIRKGWDVDLKAPTKSEIDDLAEDDPSVIEIEEQMGLLQLLMSQSHATRDAHQMYREGVSREITYRGAQMQSRMY